MKGTKLLRLDLKRGFLENKAGLLIPIGIGLILSLDVCQMAERIRSFSGSQEVAFGDFFFYAYGGMEEYIPRPSNPFVFPVVWMLVLGLCAFVVLNWPARDLDGIGQSLMVQANGKYKWWLGKCVWNMLFTLQYHLLMILGVLVCCLINGFSLSLDIHMNLIEALFKITSIEYEKAGREQLTILICIAPIVFSMALNMMQMMLSLFVKPIYSYMVVVSVLLVSSYLLSPYAIGNYAMILRYDWVLKNGVSAGRGILVSVGILLCSVLIGIWKMYHLDILKKE